VEEEHAHDSKQAAKIVKKTTDWKDGGKDGQRSNSQTSNGEHLADLLRDRTQVLLIGYE
jgi:hypothetical protein